MERVIFLDAGHNVKKDPGAVIGNRKERDLNILIRDALIPELFFNGFQVEVVPDDLDTVQSIDWINQRVQNIESGLAIQIHQNCCKGEGAETYYMDAFESSKRIARELIEEYCKETGIKNRGAKSDDTTRFGALGFIRNTECWATLIECGFLDNDKDMKIMTERLDAVVRGIAKGICKIF